MKSLGDNHPFSMFTPASSGETTVDAAGVRGIAQAGLHEICAAETAQIGAATGFAAALALRAAGKRLIVWVRQDFMDTESGALNASGLAGLGVDPERFILIRARDAEGVLRAGEQSARCAALGAVVIQPWGEPKILDFTASRRLSLASAKSSVPILLLRAAAYPSHSAATTRWSVKAAPSRALHANAPGFPAFELTLLRRRGGSAGQVLCVEWDRDRKCFQDREHNDAAAVSRPVVSISHDRPALPGAQHVSWRRAG